jgi:hypothetical protein
MLLRQILSEKLPATPSSTNFDLRNSLFCNILRANPFLAIFYADFFGRYDANPSILKDLATPSKKNFIQIDPPKAIPRLGRSRRVTPW